MEYSLYHTRAINLMTSCTNAEFATLHELDVVLIAPHMWQVPRYYHVWFFVFPVLQQNRPNITMQTSCKKCQYRLLRRRVASNIFDWILTRPYVCFWKRNILAYLESYFNVSIAEGSDAAKHAPSCFCRSLRNGAC